MLIIDILLDDPIVNYLTTTRPSNAINSILVEIGYTEDEILEYFVKGESFSNHPIAKSIIKIITMQDLLYQII